MGRYLSNGVMARFDIRKINSNKNFNLEKELENIIKGISDIIDPSMYELVGKEENCYDFVLKPEIFNKNIHELIREICPLTYPNVNYFWDFIDKNINMASKEFIENYPFTAKINKDGNYYIEIHDEIIKENDLFYPLDWIIKNDRLFENVEIHATVIMLWADENKYNGEDETNMLRIINNMKAKYYTSLLSKALIYYVTP